MSKQMTLPFLFYNLDFKILFKQYSTNCNSEGNGSSYKFICHLSYLPGKAYIIYFGLQCIEKFKCNSLKYRCDVLWEGC